MVQCTKKNLEAIRCQESGAATPLISHRKYMGRILTINVPYTLLWNRGGMAAPTSRLLMTSKLFLVLNTMKWRIHLLNIKALMMFSL